MSAKPMHGGILRDGSFAANWKSFGRAESGCYFRQATYFRAPKDSERLSTCPALRD